ncbi:MAG: prolyl oligopeptidase family serine peptidase [candidate division Zixibacteria bacterium]
MKILKNLSITIALLVNLSGTHLASQEATPANDDPYIWLEEVEGENSLEWVRAHDKTTMDALGSDPNFADYQSISLEILNSKDRIPYGKIKGDYVYNFWQDEEHVRGILRRTTLEEYKKKDPRWETLLDIDELNEKEGKSWVYKGTADLPPDYSRCMIYLSDGGKDAVYLREFDYSAKTFVNDGFYLSEAKSSVSWYDRNTLIVDTDFGPGSLTTSGYPRIVKLWKRGTDISEAVTLLEGEIKDVSAGGGVTHRPEGKYVSLQRGISFWESTKWLLNENLEKVKIPIPEDAGIETFFKSHLIVLLHSDWLGIPEGALIALNIKDLESDNLESKIRILFQPDDKSTVRRINATKDYIIVSILENVTGKALYYTLAGSPNRPEWIRGEIDLPEFGTISVKSHNYYDNTLLISYAGFLTPTKLYFLENPTAEPKAIKSRPDIFDASVFKVSQLKARSADGTIIPYFLVSAKDLNLDGTNPTLLYGYGGFRIPETPYYSGTIGKLWLEKGGVFALANIRGGGEFGPKWHKAALLENRQRAYDDFIAVAEDLINQNITSVTHLGIMGGSNGGLLVGVALTQRPDLFNAVVCQVPLLDMLRYHKLPPGASWMAEYGDPDIPENREYIAKYSPYQNLKKGIEYPDVLFVTSTKDDRVHPGHARKMAARMEEYGNKIYYYEETEGGHAASADNTQRAKRYALQYIYLQKMLSR